MYEMALEEGTRWYVLHTHPRQEDRAVSNLQAWRVETFCPKINKERQRQRAGAPSPSTKNLFPRYIFARFDLAKSLHKIQFTRGIQSVVSFGAPPTPVDDEVIQLIQSRLDDNYYVRPKEEFKFGDKVTIKDGPLNSLIGIFERDVNAKDRVAILLTTIGYQGRVLIDRGLIEKVC